ncbi:hypothetical protein D9X30_4698 (plasmid) [Cupriavidus sp. U2]|nr:hypothetical protein D9X30_4698 [Cupriavidus sp. U2]
MFRWPPPSVRGISISAKLPSSPPRLWGITLSHRSHWHGCIQRGHTQRLHKKKRPHEEGGEERVHLERASVAGRYGNHLMVVYGW